MRLPCWLMPIVLAVALDVRAQEATDQPPKVGQPADYSGIVGTIQITAQAQPSSVAVEEPLVLTVTITGRAVAPHLPQRDKLRLFDDDFQRDFYLEPRDERSADGLWEFTYQLRPKHARVTMIPGLKLVYYSPRQRRYQTAYADAMPLTITPRQQPAVVIPGLKVIQAPPSFFELANPPAAGTDASFATLSPLPWLIVLIVPPLVCVAGVVVWKRRQRFDLVRQRKSKHLVIQTIAALAEPKPDPIAAAAVLADYLQQRLNIIGAEPTPAEVERWLKRRGVSRPVRVQWRRLLSEYDAAQYAPPSERRSVPSAAEAIALIQQLEAEPCLGGC